MHDHKRNAKRGREAETVAERQVSWREGGLGDWRVGEWRVGGLERRKVSSERLKEWKTERNMEFWRTEGS